MPRFAGLRSTPTAGVATIHCQTLVAISWLLPASFAFRPPAQVLLLLRACSRRSRHRLVYLVCTKGLSCQGRRADRPARTSRQISSFAPCVQMGPPNGYRPAEPSTIDIAVAFLLTCQHLFICSSRIPTSNDFGVRYGLSQDAQSLHTRVSVRPMNGK